jgi:Flp pilus assembly protein TadG
MARRQERDQRGAAAVEFALVVPVLIMILFGLIWTGFAFADHLSATNAVREGARYGASADATSASWATSVRDRVKQVYFNAGHDITDDQICVKLVQSTGTTVASAIGANCGTAPTTPSTMTAGSCAVLVWVQRPETIRLIVAPDLNFTIGAESVAYYGRKAGTSCTAA